jgi:hypothetical protein
MSATADLDDRPIHRPTQGMSSIIKETQTTTRHDGVWWCTQDQGSPAE